MAKRRSTAHLVKYQYQPRSAPVVIRQTRVVKAKHHRRRRGGGGGSASLSTLVAGALATKVGGHVVMGMLPSGARLINDDVTLAVIAHYAHADKYVKGVQLWTKFKALDSVMSAGGLLNIFGPG